MSPRLDVRHLQVIEAVHRLGSVTRAAKSLNLTQPAVSHALREIERRLEAQVVVPNGRGVTVTAAGEKLAVRARSILDALGEAEGEVRALTEGEQGRLRLTTECYTCYHWLPGALAELRRRRPRLQLDLVPGATLRPREALRAREVDVAIVHELVEDKDIEYVPLFSDELVALVPPEHPFANRTYLEPDDFRDEHLVVHDTERSTVVTSVLVPASIAPARVTGLQLTEAVVGTVKAGLGITVMARWAVTPQIRDGSLRAIPVTKEGLIRHWWAAFPRGPAKRAGVDDLVELLRERGLS